jgi:diguanylate cyclase (GGDEF)-like protein
LLNRLAFSLVYDQTSKEAHRMGKPLSVLICDVDHFKKINDTHGHSVGDLAIVALADTLRANVRASDVCCRWGGEEFLALLPDCNGEQAMALAEKIRGVVANSKMERGGKTFTMTVSIGAAQLKTNESVDDLIHRADMAMYSAKDSGRDRTCLAS